MQADQSSARHPITRPDRAFLARAEPATCMLACSIMAHEGRQQQEAELWCSVHASRGSVDERCRQLEPRMWQVRTTCKVSRSAASTSSPARVRDSKAHSTAWCIACSVQNCLTSFSKRPARTEWLAPLTACAWRCMSSCTSSASDMKCACIEFMFQHRHTSSRCVRGDVRPVCRGLRAESPCIATRRLCRQSTPKSKTMQQEQTFVQHPLEHIRGVAQPKDKLCTSRSNYATGTDIGQPRDVFSARSNARVLHKPDAQSVVRWRVTEHCVSAQGAVRMCGRLGAQ